MKPSKQSKPFFSLKRERSQNMTCSSHGNNPIPKKCQTSFFPQISIQTVLLPCSQLCSTGGERKMKKKKSQKDSLLLFEITKTSAQLAKIMSSAHFHTEQKSNNFAPELFTGKKHLKRCMSSSLTKDLRKELAKDCSPFTTHNKILVITGEYQINIQGLNSHLESQNATQY